MTELGQVTVADVALPGEATRYTGIQRRLALYYIAVIPVMAPLRAIRWLGERAEAALDRIDLPAYRMRNELHALNREWHNRARRIREQQSQSQGEKRV